MKLLMVLPLLLLLGCSGSIDESQLTGQWTGASWEDLTNQKTIDVPVDFTFGADGRYIAHYGSQTEEGKYWISGSNLHTIEDGKAEKKVKIAKFQNDSLLFEMNRAGAIEEMLLVRSN